MIPAELKKELSDYCGHYPSRRVGAITVMQRLQAFYGGWLPDEAIAEAAEIVGIPEAEIEGIATFYNWFFRKPVGRNIIVICDSTPCWIGGCDRLQQQLENRLQIKMGETTSDGDFTLLPVVCLGNCDKAPTMMIGDELYDNVTPDIVDEILDRHRSAAKAGAR